MRIGLVGTSSWAVDVHGASLAGNPDVDLACVWGRDPAKAAAAADKLGTAAAGSFDALLEAVDAVAFAVPPDAQAPLAVRAAGAGKHVMLEKPLALGAPQARTVAEAVEAAGVASTVFLTGVWAPSMASWLQDVRAVGGWETGRAEMVSALSAEFLRDSPWRAEHGALWDVGPHALSLLEPVLGRVVDVHALRGGRDLVHLVMRHDAGATSTVELTLTAPPAAAHRDIVFWGEHGRSSPAPVLGPADVGAAYARAVGSLVAQVRGEAAQGPTAADGLHVTEVLAAAQASLR